MFLLEAKSRNRGNPHCERLTGQGVAIMVPMVFISYAHEDRQWCDRLLQYLSEAVARKQIRVFEDSQIRGGANWRMTLLSELAHASLIVVLASKAYLNSDYCKHVETKEALQNRAKKGVRIFPVLLEDCDYESIGLGHLQFMPKDKCQNLVPVSSLADSEGALARIAEDVIQTAGGSRPRILRKPRLLMAVAIAAVVVAGLWDRITPPKPFSFAGLVTGIECRKLEKASMSLLTKRGETRTIGLSACSFKVENLTDRDLPVTIELAMPGIDQATKINIAARPLNNITVPVSDSTSAPAEHFDGVIHYPAAWGGLEAAGRLQSAAEAISLTGRQPEDGRLAQALLEFDGGPPAKLKFKLKRLEPMETFEVEWMPLAGGSPRLAATGLVLWPPALPGSRAVDGFILQRFDDLWTIEKEEIVDLIADNKKLSAADRELRRLLRLLGKFKAEEEPIKGKGPELLRYKLLQEICTIVKKQNMARLRPADDVIARQADWFLAQIAAAETVGLRAVSQALQEWSGFGSWAYVKSGRWPELSWDEGQSVFLLGDQLKRDLQVIGSEIAFIRRRLGENSLATISPARIDYAPLLENAQSENWTGIKMSMLSQFLTDLPPVIPRGIPGR